MAHPYEYKLWFEYYTPIVISGKLDFAKSHWQENLDSFLNNLMRQFPDDLISMKKLGDGWEPVSHSLTFQGKTGVISILLRRPRT